MSCILVSCMDNVRIKYHAINRMQIFTITKDFLSSRSYGSVSLAWRKDSFSPESIFAIPDTVK